MLLLRHQIHSSPLYTSKRTSIIDPTAPRKTYGQAQMNAIYSVKNKASLDPFTAMPTYSQKFVREERALPDWSSRPTCRSIFPAELHETIDGGRKKRKLELSSVSALPNAEEAFGMPALDGETGNSLEKRLEDWERQEAGDDAGGEVEDDEGGEEEEEDEIYDDEDAGDYDAENYFDNGDDMGDDYGDGDDGEGTF